MIKTIYSKFLVKKYEFALEPGTEYFLNLKAVTKEADGLIEKGAVLASEQLVLPIYKSLVVIESPEFSPVSFEEAESSVTVTGKDFYLDFNTSEGIIASFKKGDVELIKSGLVPNFWRAPIDNDFGNNLYQANRVWREAGNNREVLDVSIS